MTGSDLGILELLSDMTVLESRYGLDAISVTLLASDGHRVTLSRAGGLVETVRDTGEAVRVGAGREQSGG